jgi:hypothetical protein
VCVLVLLLIAAADVTAQELEPRSYSPAPVGTTFVLANLGRSAGAILFDPSADVDNVRADLWVASWGAGRTFGLGGRQARLLAVFPLALGEISGEIGGGPQKQHVAGLIDPRFRFSIGLRGAPALTVEEFATAPQRTAIGAGVTVIAPLGQYREGELVNLGYNRWAFKPEVGVSRPLGQWTIDGHVGVWFYSPNNAHFPGNARKEQDPLVSYQGHLSYSFHNRVWMAFDSTWFEGGQTRVTGGASPDLQRNLRVGGVLSVPIGKRQSLKFVYSTGAITSRGADFDSFNVTWQRVTF